MENFSTQNSRILNYKEWALTIFITGIPVAGIIMLLVWAFSEETNIHKKNWAKGNLLLMLIMLIIFAVFVFFFGGLAILANMSNKA
ncbi:MAG: hypothetical protein J7K34_09545 [Flavobacteriaceae bacterium]|nr:hypothetical protein [Flavobacteriaceae bacterium]